MFSNLLGGKLPKCHTGNILVDIFMNFILEKIVCK